MIMNAAVGHYHHYIRNEIYIYIVQCIKQECYVKAHHKGKVYRINFHLPNVETNLKVRSPAKQKGILHFVILHFHVPLQQGTEHSKHFGKTIQISIAITYRCIFYNSLAEEKRVATI